MAITIVYSCHTFDLKQCIKLLTSGGINFIQTAPASWMTQTDKGAREILMTRKLKICWKSLVAHEEASFKHPLDVQPIATVAAASNRALHGPWGF